MMTIETHPFEPFLPESARVLFLGSFPPQEHRWSMDFYYPNFINDFWRIIGLIFFDDRDRFIIPGARRFDKGRIIAFCRDRGIALYDTATAVRRLRDNASDAFLEVVTPTDIPALLQRIPRCEAIVTTGEKATQTLALQWRCTSPPVGGSSPVTLGDRQLRFCRLPSTSRAYPLPLPQKTAAYRRLFEELGMR